MFDLDAYLGYLLEKSSQLPVTKVIPKLRTPEPVVMAPLRRDTHIIPRVQPGAVTQTYVHPQRAVTQTYVPPQQNSKAEARRRFFSGEQTPEMAARAKADWAAPEPRPLPSTAAGPARNVARPNLPDTQPYTHASGRPAPAQRVPTQAQGSAPAQRVPTQAQGSAPAQRVPTQAQGSAPAQRVPTQAQGSAPAQRRAVSPHERAARHVGEHPLPTAGDHPFWRTDGSPTPYGTKQLPPAPSQRQLPPGQRPSNTSYDHAEVIDPPHPSHSSTHRARRPAQQEHIVDIPYESVPHQTPQAAPVSQLNPPQTQPTSSVPSTAASPEIPWQYRYLPAMALGAGTMSVAQQAYDDRNVGRRQRLLAQYGQQVPNY